MIPCRWSGASAASADHWLPNRDEGNRDHVSMRDWEVRLGPLLQPACLPAFSALLEAWNAASCAKPSRAQEAEAGRSRRDSAIRGAGCGVITVQKTGSWRSVSFLLLLRPCLDVVGFISSHMCWSGLGWNLVQVPLQLTPIYMNWCESDYIQTKSQCIPIHTWASPALEANHMTGRVLAFIPTRFFYLNCKLRPYLYTHLPWRM